MNDDPDFRSRYFTGNIPRIHELQKKLGPVTALLSWHISEYEIIVFVITASQSDYYKLPFDNLFRSRLDSLKTSLYNASTEQRYTGASVSAELYQSLIYPLEPMLLKIKRLIIIPDDELNYLPFEALMDGNGRYLVERFSTQYQYSTSLLGKDKPAGKTGGTLAFAPFASRGFIDSTGQAFAVLPASGEETGGLSGKVFTDSSASKANFLFYANHYGIIHLATHAKADNESPLHSFITFYPTSGENRDAYQLYAGEIYNLRLDSAKLVILSACETGTGKLVKGEGLMSLSRAFAYAGCPNIIASLWKAEDKTTAFITQKLHHYLDKGYSKDRALQQAKLDLLKSRDMDPRLKTPDCWAHLIFIGNYEPGNSSSPWWWIAISIILVALFFMATNKKA
jgi:CHAT domain-containing protein